jgi:uncharacterized membrane protein YphA (DoxX/SURF4 family)
MPGSVIISLAAFVAGGLLLIGYLTPIVAIVVALGVVGTTASLLPAYSTSVFDSKSALVFALTILLSVIGLGPGAFSLDARRFGRREILIAPRIDRHDAPEERGD